MADARGRSVVLSGATSGIGRAAAEALAAGGARLTLVGKNAALLRGLASELGPATDWADTMRRAPSGGRASGALRLPVAPGAVATGTVPARVGVSGVGAGAGQSAQPAATSIPSPGEKAACRSAAWALPYVAL